MACKTKIGIAVLGIALAINPITIPEQKLRSYVKVVRIDKSAIPPCFGSSERLNELRKELPERLDSCLKDGKWQINGLLELQGEYLQARNNACPADVVNNNIPIDLVRLMPTINRIAKAHDVDPYLVAGIITGDSFWYQGAINNSNGAFKRRRQIAKPELSIGLMQINLIAHKNISDAEYQTILNPEVNINIGASLLHNLIKRFNGNLDMAIMAYNRGPLLAHRRVARKDSYVKKVKSYMGLIKQAMPPDSTTAWQLPPIRR